MALINVVFLLLVFFLVAGTLSRPLAGDLTLVRTDAPGFAPPPDALVLHADGTLSFRGEPATTASYLAGADGPSRLVPDREARAVRVIEVAQALRAGGAERVMIVAEKAAP